MAHSETLDYDALVSVLRAAAANVKDGADLLGRLDSAVGDGDHGLAMTRAMDALENAIDACTDRTAKALMQGVAWAVASIDAGSTGPLFGSLLMGMVEPIGDDATVDAPLLASMFEAGLAKLRTISKAEPGDKTMIDALVPGVAALRAAADRGDSASAALHAAAEEAETGAERTKDFQAKFGKARNLAERSIGHKDPGATSMAMLFRGLADGAAALNN